MKKRKILLGLAVFSVLFGVTTAVVSCNDNSNIEENETDDPDLEDGTGGGETEVEPVVDKYLEITSPPTKTIYTINEYFTTSGLQVQKVEITDNVETFRENVDVSDLDLSIPNGEHLTEVGTFTVTIGLLSDDSYSKTSFDIVVNDYNRYTVTFYDEDESTVLDQSTVIDGQYASFNGETPSKASTDNYAYHFDGWYVKGDSNKTIISLNSYAITSNTDFVASFSVVDLQGTDGTFSYTLTGDGEGYIITDFNTTNSITGDTNRVVVVPDEYNGLPVVGIDNGTTNYQGVFYNEDSVTSVTLGANVEYIGDGTFASMDGSGLTITLNEGLEEIGERAFNLNKGITSLTIPGTVKEIPDRCFYNCTSLTSLTLEEGVEGFSGGSIFYYANVEVLTLPDSFTHFYEGSFTGYNALTTLNIGAGLTDENLSNSTLFAASGSSLANINVDSDNPNFVCNDGYTLLSNDEKTLYGVARMGGPRDENGDLTDSTYTIPDTVEIVESNAFNYFKNGSWTQIVLGANVRELGSDSLRNNSGNVGLTFNENLQIIGDGAFNGFYGSSSTVSELVLPDSVTTIGDEAFSGCRSLTSITFGTDIQYFGIDMFASCSNLDNYYISDNLTYLTRDGNVLLDKELTEVRWVLPNEDGESSFTLPETVTSIARGAFNDNETITELIIPTTSKLEYIGEEAFSETEIASDIFLPSTLKYVGDNAFYNSDSITSIDYPGTITNIGSGAFRGLTSATFTGNLLIPENSTIGDSAFKNCPRLTTIDVQVDLTNNLFEDCSGLVSITLKDDISVIPDSCFYDCTSLSSIVLPSTVLEIEDDAFRNTSSLLSISLPSNLTTIGQYAFSGSGIEEITIPSSVTSLDTYVFSSTENLATVNFENTLQTLPNSTFRSATGLKHISWPSGLTEIGDYAFYGSGLEEIEVPSGVKTLGQQAFYQNYSLRRAILPHSLTTVGTSLLAYCTSLTEVDLGGLTSIYSGMFYGCTSLTSFTIPSGVTEIGLNAFYGSGLTEFTLSNGVTFASSGTNAFNSCASLKTFNWNSTLATSIPNYTFSGCSALTEFNVDEGVSISTIGTYAFQNSGLTATPFDLDTVTSIGQRAFYGCSSLASIDLPRNSGYTEIANYLLYGCSSLTSLVIPKNVTTIGTYAANNCSSLQDITIENGSLTSSTSTSNAPFARCTAIETINFYGTVEEATALLTPAKFFGTTSLSGVVVNVYDETSGALTDTGSYTYSNSSSTVTF